MNMRFSSRQADDEVLNVSFDADDLIFIKRKAYREVLIVSIYIGNLIFREKLSLGIMNDVADSRSSMDQNVDLIDLGKVRYFLCLEISPRSNEFYLSQKKYVLKVLQRFGMDKQKDKNGVKVDKMYFKQILAAT